MEKIKSITILIFITLVSSLFLGCIDNSEPTIVGTWEWEENNQVKMTFFDDGRLIQYLPPQPTTGPREIHSTYIVNNTHLTITHIASPTATTIVEADFEFIDANTIIISYDNGSVQTYYKISD
jgi:hypothetical protein